MNTCVEFQSSKFSPYDEEGEVNPGRWGQRLAEYLYDKLEEQGVEVDDIYPEDWGWVIRLVPQGFPMWLGCGNLDENPNRYLIFIEPSKPVFRKLFRKIDTTTSVSRVADALDAILKSDPDIQDIRWRPSEEK